MSKRIGKIHYAWFLLFGLCIMVGLGRGGLNNSGGLFLTPVTEDLGISYGNLSIYFSIASIVTMLFLPIAGKLIAKYDVRLVMIVATVLQGGAFAAFGLMSSVWGWYILAIPLATGSIFITLMAAPVLINSWFKKNNGLAMGIVIAASSGIGAIIQPFIGSGIGASGWRTTYIVTGLGVVVVSVIIILLLIRKPADKNMLPYGASESAVGDSSENKEEVVEGILISDARKTSSFYGLILFFFIITSIGSFSMHIPSYAQDLGHDVAFAGGLLSTFMIGMLFGALAFGFLSDRIGARNTALIAMVLGIVSIILLIFFSGTTAILSLAVGIFGFVSASTGTLGPVLTSSVFGIKNYSEIYSNVSLGLAVAGIISLPIYGYIFEFTGSFVPVLYLLMGMMIVGIVALIVIYKGKDKMLKAGLWK